MPLGAKPICTVCKTVNTTMWRKGHLGEVLCNSCSLKHTGTTTTLAGPTKDDQNDNGSNHSGNGKNDNNSGPTLRKSARIKPSKRKAQAFTKSLATKGKNRRVIFKKNPIKAPESVSTVVTSECIFYDGMYYQLGDIVSLVDHDGGVYYAQIRGFMEDQYTEKSAVITWLLPTQSSPSGRFDPSTFILGPEEDLPRKMEFMEFVCHAPSDYFKARSGPYRTLPAQPELCYIATSMDSQIQLAPTMDEIFGVDTQTSKIILPTGSGKRYARGGKVDRS